jgi:hypothetical protein
MHERGNDPSVTGEVDLASGGVQPPAEDMVWPSGGAIDEQARAPHASGTGETSEGGSPPPWLPRMIRQGIWWAILAILATLAALWFLGLERDLVRYLVLAGLLSLALEPAVIWLHEKHGWRRGSATALLLVGTLVALILFAVGVTALVAREVDLILQRLPTYIDNLNAFTRDHFDTTVISASQRAAAADATTYIKDYLSDHSQDILGTAGSILSGIFTLFTVALFTFYLTADGPKVRRVLLSRVPPERQRRAQFAWDTAIRKVGGYLYSLLALRTRRRFGSRSTQASNSSSRRASEQRRPGSTQGACVRSTQTSLQRAIGSGCRVRGTRTRPEHPSSLAPLPSSGSTQARSTLLRVSALRGRSSTRGYHADNRGADRDGVSDSRHILVFSRATDPGPGIKPQAHKASRQPLKT